MDGSSHLRCLIPKIRALVSNFPVLEARLASSTNTTVKSPSPFLCKEMKGRIRIGLFEIVVKDASRPAVLWLKIKPKVLIFPSKSSRFTATFTHTTIKSLSLFLRPLWSFFVCTYF